MSALPQSAVRNKLLSLLPAKDYQLVARDLTHVTMPRGTLIAASGKPIENVFFLESGIGSILITTPEGHRAEGGLFGFEGYVPTAAIADVELSSHEICIQLHAEAYRMEYRAFRGWMERNVNFRRLMIRSIEAFSVQLAYTAVSNAVHAVDERLARWLLMCHDRVAGHEIQLTHDYISLILAVRRPSVTTALHVLEGNGYIKAERGVITIRNRPGLEEFARDAYGRPEEEYRRLMKDLF